MKKCRLSTSSGGLPSDLTSAATLPCKMKCLLYHYTAAPKRAKCKKTAVRRV